MIKKKKFLLIPNKSSHYDLNQLNEIKKQLLNFGHSARVLKDRVSDFELINITSQEYFDCIFRVNFGRPEKLNKNIRFISWFQDFYHNSNEELYNFQKDDIVYFYASPKSFGVKKKLECFSSQFYPGISNDFVTEDLPSINSKKNIKAYQHIDFSICGYIPSAYMTNLNTFYFRNYPLEENHSQDEIFRGFFRNFADKREKIKPIEDYKKFVIDLQTITELNYQPLSGKLNVEKISNLIKKKISENFEFVNVQLFNEWISFFSTEYPRFLDRIKLARLISTNSFNIALIGEGWSSFNEFENLSLKKIDDLTKLYEFYRKSKVNLYNNTHGLGMHSKVFEIMINGGFVALPISSRNNMLGGIEECFIDGEHFSSFNPHKFDEFIDNWLNNSEKRLLIGSNARKEVLDKHTWRSRIYKLLNDLSH